jgi:hypothetical protein
MSPSSSKNPVTVADLVGALTPEQREKVDALARGAAEFVSNVLRAVEQLARPALTWLATEFEKDPDVLDKLRAALEYGKDLYIAAPVREPQPEPTLTPPGELRADDDDDDYN